MNPHKATSESGHRWSADWYSRRLRREAERSARHPSSRDGKAPRLAMPYWLLGMCLRVTGLYPRGYRNFLDIQVRSADHFIAGWPATREPLILLQLSDLHLDLDRAHLLPVLLNRLKGIRCDLAVFTGDYLESTINDQAGTLAGMRQILETIGQPPLGSFGVLGNHDSVEFADKLESLGLPILVSEARICDTPAGPFAVAGVDDAYFFAAADVAAAATACPDGLPSLLLSHSPQVAPQARAAGFSLMLSGHTHGGQICLPGGRALLHMEEIPPPLFRGPWRMGALHGYTTTGTGCSHLPLRFHCPPEIVLHRIHSASG